MNNENIKLKEWIKYFRVKGYYHKWSLFILDEVLTIGATRDLRDIYVDY